MSNPGPKELYLCSGCLFRDPWKHLCVKDEEDDRMCECKVCADSGAEARALIETAGPAMADTLQDATPGQTEAAVHAYCREVVLARQARRADRSELHPGDIGLDIDGDVQVLMRLKSRDAMKAALEAAARIKELEGKLAVERGEG